MLISGSIGYIHLKNNIKNIHIFLDNHTNNKYCNNSNQIFLHEFIKKYILDNANFCIKKQCNLNIFLEELIDEKNMIPLHKDTYHVNKFLNFYKNILKNEYNQYTFPFDIRQFLQVIDIVSIINNIENYSLLNCKYLFYYLNIILDLKLKLNNIDKNLIDNNIIKQVYKIKKTLFKKFKNNNLKEHYKSLRNNALILYKKINIPIKNCSENNLIELSYLIDNIMEFYCILLIINNSETEIIIYAGAYHCLNIANKLINNYKYKIKYNSTTIDITNLHIKYKNDNFLDELDKYSNCIKL